MSATLIITVITCIVSFLAFQNAQLQSKLLLYPVVMRKPKEAYRLITSGFVHADMMHLVFNMFAFYSFGNYIEAVIGMERFVLMYLSGIVVANLPSYYKHMSNPQYAALGASGGVAAIIFAYVYMAPWEKIYLLFALPIPAILLAIAYLIYSYVMSKKPDQRIGHDAHFWGAVYGFLFMLVVVDPTHGTLFFKMLMQPHF